MLNDAVSGILDLQGNWAVVLGSTLWFPKPAMRNKQERQWSHKTLLKKLIALPLIGVSRVATFWETTSIKQGVSPVAAESGMPTVVVNLF